MPLTYTKRIPQRAYTYEPVEISVPKRWGMFSGAGNRSIRLKAESFLRDMEKLNGSMTKCTARAIRFLKSYRKMHKSKTFGEASDTEVRECVWGFFEKVCAAVDLDADSIWESKESYEGVWE